MTMPVTLLSYDIVMATRNRPEAVALSLPLILAQTRPPRAVFVVDASDDGAPIAGIVETAAAGTGVPVHYIRSGRGSALQRNVGIRRGQGDVVIFPDDDSLLHPETAARMMAVYEADRAGVVAAVCARPAAAPPPGVLEELQSYAADTPGPLRSALRHARHEAKEIAGIANPFVVVGRRLNAQHPVPAWLASLSARPVPYMTGFRMSFRRSAIAAGFDETLSRYAWFEDIDASFAAMRQGLVVSAEMAEIYHHRAAAARDNGYRMGLWAMLNRAYVVTKHVHANPSVFPHPTREALRLRAYCTARTLVYAVSGRGSFARARARGARAGLRALGAFTRAPADRLSEVYDAFNTDAVDHR